MERKVNFDEWQKVTLEDFDNLGQFPRDSIDHLVKDLGPGWGFSGFSCSEKTTTIVTVGNGHLYTSDGPIYFNATSGGVDIDMSANLPSQTKKIVGVVAWGTEILTETEPRTFITNTTSRATEATPVSTESRRHCNIQAYYGIEGPDPQKPSIPSNVLAVAWITLDTAGIVTIAAEETNRVKGLYNHETRLGALDIWRNSVGSKIDTLGSDLATLAGRIAGLATLDLLLKLVVDVTRLKETSDLPDTYSSYGADYFLDSNESDTDHPDYLARTEEGLRFAKAAERFATLALANVNDEKASVTDDFLLPAYDEVRRLSNVQTIVVYPVKLDELIILFGQQLGPLYWYSVVKYAPWVGITASPYEISISQYATQTINWIMRHRVRYRVRWGNMYWWSSRINFWWDRKHDPVWWAFRRLYNDSTFVIMLEQYYAGRFFPPQQAWRYVWARTKWYWHDRIVDWFYWERYITTHGVNGSVVAQTFLNGQDGWLTRVHLFFTRRGPAGDVTLLLCECTDSGQPNKDAMIAMATLTRSDIAIWPYATPVMFSPVLLTAGKRYAIIPITTGAHYLATTDRNKYLGGTLFYSTDGVWFQGLGDMTRDLCFELVFAQWDANRYEIQLASASLTDGISAIDINADAQVPEGTSLTYEVQLSGVWTPMADPGPDANTPPLNGLPDLLQLRAVFQGSSSLMPGLALGTNTELYTWRGRTDIKHISEPCNEGGGTVTSVIVKVRLEAWRGDPHHTCVCKLLVGSGFSDTETHDTGPTDIVAPDDPDAIIRTWTFTGISTVEFKVQLEGTTDNANLPWHAAERLHIALA